MIQQIGWVMKNFRNWKLLEERNLRNIRGGDRTIKGGVKAMEAHPKETIENNKHGIKNDAIFCGYLFAKSCYQHEKKEHGKNSNGIGS